MTISAIHSFLVHPDKHSSKQTKIRGAIIKMEGRLYRLLAEVFEGSDTECKHDISFNHNADGSQNNACREIFLDYVKSPSIPNGRLIAERLQSVTNKISGLGLLFLIVSEQKHERKLVVSRFPADSAILAEESESSLTVEFLEKVFMKSATAYKAAVYRGASLTNDFWNGRAIDKQINSNVIAISHYWIRLFLDSDFRTTPGHGTRRLALALLEATRRVTDLDVKGEIAAASRLADNLDGMTISVKNFCNRFGLSDDSQKAIASVLPTTTSYTDNFQFSSKEYAKHIRYRTIELDNGAVLTGQVDQFEDIFKRELLDPATQSTRFSTQGTIVNQKLKKSK